MKQINGALRVCILFFILLVVLQCVKVTTEEEFQVSELKFVLSQESLVSKQNKKLDLIRLDLELKDPSGQAQTNRWTPGLTNILEFRTTSAGLHKLTIETVNRTFESNRTEFGIRVVSGEPYRIRVRLGRTVTLQMDDLVAQKTSDILPDKATNIIKTGLVSNTNLMIVKIDKILTNETKLVTDAQTNLVIQQTVTDQTAVLIETNLVETNDVIGTNTNFISPTNMVAFVTTNMDAVFSDTNELIDMQTSNVNTVSNINL